MPIDVVFPKNNEQLFLEQAEKLGIDELIFTYKTIDEARRHSKEHTVALFIATPSQESVRKLCAAVARYGIQSLVQAGSIQFNRFILEKTQASALVNVEFTHKNDHTHFRRSGLDQVLCKLAARNKKSVLCSMSRLLDIPDRGLILGRIAQNIRFCRKYGVSYGLASFAHEPLEMKGARDLKSLMHVLE